MVEFFEPEDEFKVDKGRRRNTKTKIAFLVGLLILGFILILAVHFDVVNFFKEDKIQEICVYGNTYNRVDDDALKLDKIKKTLSNHLGTISDLDGFLNAKIKFNKSIKNHKIPVINLVFKKSSVDKKRIPKALCGFEIILDIKE